MELTLDVLKHDLSGDVVMPGDSKYDQLRNVMMREGSPAVIVRPRNVEDVQRAVRFASDQGLVLSVRSGGHSGAGFGTNVGGLVIDMTLMNAVKLIDASKNIVRIGTGARWVEVANALAAHGLAISSGDTTSVGVGGLLLGGGIGWMVRKYGLALDNLAAAEVVTADGRLLRASAEENADLFWALRGGGGNFGVITTFDMVAHPLKGVFFGNIAYPKAEATAVLKGWRDYIRTATEDVTTTLRIMPPFGEAPPMVLITVAYAGDDADAAQRAVEPLLHLGTVLSHDIKAMPYVEVLEEPGEMPPGFNPMANNRFARELSDEFIGLLVDSTSKIGPMFVELRSLGGAMRRVPSDATAFAYRDSEVLVISVIFDRSPEVVSQFEALWQALAPMTAGAYSNFVSTAGDEEVATVYPPETYARLAAIKRKYDPRNLFNQNLNIKPAGA